jgi:serine/threonine-protein kinase RsbW
MNEQVLLTQTVHINLPASLKYLKVLGACLKTVLAQEQSSQGRQVQERQVKERQLMLNNVWLAVHEICVNIVEHAYTPASEQARIEVSIFLNRQDRCLTIHLVDTGQPFDMHDMERPPLMEGQVHGYGLFLARSLMDTVNYQRQGSKNCWSLEKCLCQESV